MDAKHLTEKVTMLHKHMIALNYMSLVTLDINEYCKIGFMLNGLSDNMHQNEW